MVSSLRYAIRKNYGDISYLHYYRKMVRDYELGKWDFDIRTIVKNVKIEVPCPKYIAKKGYIKRLCLTVIDEELFKKEFDRYFNGYIKPTQELRKNIVLARRVFVSKFGYFTKYNQDCSRANYNCKNCESLYECDLSRKLSKNDDHIYRITRLAEILYGNIHHGHWADMLEM